MARRGYFEEQGDKFRLRIVAEGYDADDENVPPNKVIIDSDNYGTLSVFRSGIYTAYNNSQINGVWIAQGWDLPYVPLCTFLFTYGYYQATYTYMEDTPGDSRLDVTRDGIYLKLYGLNEGGVRPQFPFTIRWSAYRLPVI